MFGHYRVEDELGGGRTGVVHRAYDTRAGRTVALKRLRPGLPDDAALRARFRRESERVAGLSAPNLVPIHDVGEIDGQLYIDMKLVAGQDLATVLLRTGQLEPALVAAVVVQVAAALDVAHENGLVHRDVKPSNVLLDERRRRRVAWLVDFGVATTTVHEPGSSAPTDVDAPAYTAPEMFYDVAVDRRTDVYGLACFAFELLTGRPPYGVHGTAAMAEHLTMEPPRLSFARPGLPVELDDVLARGMAKRPDDRFATAPEFGDALAAVLDPAVDPLPDDAGSDRGGDDRRRRSRTAIVAGVTVLAAVSFAAVGVIGLGAGDDGPTEPGPARVGTSRTGAGGNDATSLTAVRTAFPQAGGSGCQPVTVDRLYAPLASVGCSVRGAYVYYEVWQDEEAVSAYFEGYRSTIGRDRSTGLWTIPGSQVEQGPYLSASSGKQHMVIALYTGRRYSITVTAANEETATTTFRSIATPPVEEIPR